ncbi:hypothetical protein P171DRAFT_488649 [Karstenula rhodostoma CBS 690.94]|uniref:F-box domain-containing protein n=1 Tax=Karstenula rhodostoma CBS 690.94 TaxID=1392251 RepID=A0A9P4PDB3_9PLEO|nr:hypothetical protein P171DRAFT_488649 [Karstenula rhodostoma CBS 690.94]
MESLPNELLDHIITHVAHSNDGRNIQDASSLANCCLVSKSFYECTKPVLYSTIHLDLMTDEPSSLLKTFKSDVQLARNVKGLFIQCGTPCSTPIQHISQLRDFLAEALPFFVNLTTFRSDHRIATIKLVETSLYHNTGGYSMGVPINLGNIRTLELFAADYIYKYNYILRLPQLRRVLLHSMKIIDLDGDDRAYPDDWGWVSHSIKELEIHQGFRAWNSSPYRLWSNSLQALARSMPALSYLRLFHYECTFYPRQSHHLLGFFRPQLRNSLHRLAVEDGRIDARHPEFGYNYLEEDVSILEDITASGLEYLSIDLHTLFTRGFHMGLVEAIHAAGLPPSLRYLHLRHTEVNDMSSVGDTSALLDWDPEIVVQELARKCPSLSNIKLELRLLRNPNYDMLERYKTAFASQKIRCNTLVHKCPAQRRTSIICSRAT